MSGQLVTGALSDRTGRKPLIVWGMWIQAAGIGVVTLAHAFAGFVVGAVLLGIGTAMVYPTLLAAIGDVAHPSWRASAVGVYRLWRDLGYAIGALLAGVTADAFGLHAAMWVIAALTFASGRRVGGAHGGNAARRCVRTTRVPTGGLTRRPFRPLATGCRRSTDRSDPYAENTLHPE